MQAENPPTRVSLNLQYLCLRAPVRKTELPGTVGPRWRVQVYLASQPGRLLLTRLPPTLEASDCACNWGPSSVAGGSRFELNRSCNISEPRINDRIRVPEVRLVGPAGEQVGVVRIEDALRLAAESDLDLVEVAPQAKPPVCKLMDFGKYKYEAAVKAREARKNQTNTVLKEIRFRLKIDTHDYETKRGHAMRFLAAGDKVKAMIQFRGREQQRPEMGMKLLNKFAADVAEVGMVESTPRIDGRNMVMVIGPLKNKAEAKAEARRASQRADAKAANEAVKNGEAPARVDTSAENKAPLTQSLADLLPDGLRLGSSAAEADKARVEKEIADKEMAEKRALAAAEKAAADARRAAQAAKAPAPAPVAEAPAAPAPAAESKPAPAPKPAAVPKPTAMKPAPKPAARPKPAAAAKPASASKPAGKAAPSRNAASQNKPGTAE
ncbi:translation initiation factor IF-3 [Arthrobacter sp. zg-ZUI100]|uniref:Translation initiation factor IF-3 n=1 Tax=Arthrobacter jiangjiafuii TaxID=2817475 RepID=A0A975M710_9MICC|nr:translation initiation factor IF-3 [Arthrobacter jiangjiafuii]MBP3036957.1 translation initiation factor IF-3 [Arthrobacter jiangjiafuii]MBP3044153.1 translation initiation factor IF-3 [Arthrobacter jiangjiafuii]QWC11125.1 translation initiation factor IF-3 [Arthrobacter jiangjiafuii]